MSQNVNLELNKGIAGTAGLVGFCGVALFASTFTTTNPLVAGGAAGFISYALGYMSARVGAAVIIINVLLFLAAFKSMS